MILRFTYGSLKKNHLTCNLLFFSIFKAVCFRAVLGIISHNPHLVVSTHAGYLFLNTKLSAARL